ncbi:hypothetical protein J5N97_025725 [Dioscorea zingiberensis]|uniref:C2 NT-type domain-containing protein n=1 Tax=Dioscorea zingiberensis TaxID=325984 RepID=A0A9D5C1W5_9LILI|nr:hypothetical protein J5N97_025725 [Dioscorea zingiberensis]
MVVKKVMKWSPWSPAPTSPAKEKYNVILKVIKVEGLVLPAGGGGDTRLAAVEVKWKGPLKTKGRSRLSYFRGTKSSKTARRVSGERPVERDGAAVWNDGKDNEFENLCCFFNKDSSSPWEVSFSILYGSQQERKKGKTLEEIGTTEINLGEWVYKYKGEFTGKESERKMVPITIRREGLSCNAMLHVMFNLVELRTSQGTSEKIEDKDSSCHLDTEVMDLSQLLNLNEGQEKFNTSSSNSSSSSSNNSAGSSPLKHGLFSWSKRRKNSSENVNEKEAEISNYITHDVIEEDPIGRWEQREYISRDKQTKLKTQTFFASIDQRDESANGESACTTLVAVITDAIHRSRLNTPTRVEFDRLIREGSSDWQKLCRNETYVQQFPNKHFDLETILEAKVRPINVVSEKSFIGFFQPESFESLQGAMSFDNIWEEITAGIHVGDQKVYIVSWNDHFFVLKLETNAYQIIDTLGERLFEGCNKAYILEFDEASEMYRLPENAGDDTGGEPVCRGKECCREFIKRFLAAIPLREELEMEEKGKENGTTSMALHQRLQIDFHLTEALYQFDS